jgi:quinoprotein dehydrogenase-associated probable ABC transporter substrate-binding protein
MAFLDAGGRRGSANISCSGAPAGLWKRVVVMSRLALFPPGPVFGALALLTCPFSAAAQSPTGELVARTELRVCADPHHLPYSDEEGEGFENKIAELLGKHMSLPVRYTWFPQVIGFVRNTLQAGRCDLIMGTVAGDEIVQTTTPYYYTSYVIVYRNDSGWSFSGFDDPKLKSLHIGVIAKTPPADLLVHHDLMANAQPYSLMVDTRYESPDHQLINDVVAKNIDAGLIWGPIAGYYIHHDHLPLTIVVLKSEPDGPRMAYHISMGVRNNEVDWRRRLNTEIHAHQDEINAILRDYGIPLLDEQGQPLEP